MSLPLLPRLLPRLLPLGHVVRSASRSPTRLLLSIVGSAMIVLLAVTAGAFVRGMERALQSAGSPENAILLGAGSEESIERSEVDPSTPGVVAASVPGIRARAGVEYVSPEIHVQLPVRLPGSVEQRPAHTDGGGDDGSTRDGAPEGEVMLLRGVTPAALLVHSTVQMVDGHFPRPGHDEVMVGSLAAMRLGVDAQAIETGSSLIIDGRPWRISGRFVATDGVIGAELWTALGDLAGATRRESISCVVVTLDPTLAEFADLDVFTKIRPDLELSALEERAYFEALSGFFAPIRIVTWITAGLIAFGGLLGGVNIAFAAILPRIREVGTLRAMGYRRRAILFSFMQEALLATCAGALLAVTAAILLLDGVAVRFASGIFGLVVDEVTLAIGLCVGLALGVLGVIPPAWSVLRRPIAETLKAI